MSSKLYLECRESGVLTKHQITPHFQESNDKLYFSRFLTDVTTFDLTAGCISWRAAKGRAQPSQYLLINPQECVEEVTKSHHNITLPLQKRWVDHPRPHCKAACLNSLHSSDIPGSKLLPQLPRVQLILCRNPQKGPFWLQRNPSLCRESIRGSHLFKGFLHGTPQLETKWQQILRKYMSVKSVPECLQWHES